MNIRRIAAAFCLNTLLAHGAAAAPIRDVRVANGALKGILDGPVAKFLGIPYAAPPVGQNRWRAPQPAPNWSGVRAADKKSPGCFQRVSVRAPTISEDCLYLNVWTPAQSKNARLPVLFWIYGGAFQSGSTLNPNLDGEALAKKGIIVVNFNFRMGAFGFLAHPELSREGGPAASGTYGMLDVIAALRWVRANIAAFGGDPNAITVGGQSSGAGQVKILDVSPLTRGLYARTIIQSGPRVGSGGYPLKPAEEQGVRFANSLGAHSLAELRAVPAEKILAGSEEGKSGFRFAPIFDGYVQPEAPMDMIKRGEFNKIPTLAGYTYDEQTFQHPKADKMTPQECVDYIKSQAGATWGPKFVDGFLSPPSSNCYDDIRGLSRARHLLATQKWAEARLAHGAPVYTYLFTQVPPGPDAARMRSYHGGEIVYQFGTLDTVPERPFTQKDRDVSEKMMGYWANFVKTGNPNGPGLPYWPRVVPGQPQVMEIGNRFAPRAVIDDKSRLELMQEYLTVEGPRTLTEGPLPFSR